MGEVLSARKFAELVDRSNVWVSKMVKEGRLPTDASGKIPKEAGLQAFYEAAGVLGYEANRANAEKIRAAAKESAKKPVKTAQKQPAKAAQKAGKAGSLGAGATAAPPSFAPVQQSIELPEDDEAALRMLQEGRLTRNQTEALYGRWKAKEKHLQVQMREADVRRKQGSLLDQSTVESDAVTTALELVEMLRSLPPRIAGLCEMKSAREVESVLDKEINAALGVLRQSRYAAAALED